jgi:hypothetical protein
MAWCGELLIKLQKSVVKSELVLIKKRDIFSDAPQKLLCHHHVTPPTPNLIGYSSFKRSV